MKVYTKTGDKGTTSLIGGERVAKFDERVEAYGAVDELSAFIALLGDKMRQEGKLEEFAGEINRINSQLMTVEALLAVGKGGEGKVAPLGDGAIGWLEERIDSMQAQVPAITKFTIPGGNELLSLCHVCRTVCRRAERCAVKASVVHGSSEQATTYLNRLADYLYLLGRTTTHRLGIEEIEWIP